MDVSTWQKEPIDDFSKQKKKHYLIPRLSFSKFMSSLFFFFPHFLLISTVSMNLNVPSLIDTHLIVSEFSRSSSNKNFQRRMFFAPIKKFCVMIYDHFKEVPHQN